jgi:hypothetical protein
VCGPEDTEENVSNGGAEASVEGKAGAGKGEVKVKFNASGDACSAGVANTQSPAGAGLQVSALVTLDGCDL